MQKNTSEVFRKWWGGVPFKKCDSIWTDGIRIMSYGTCILELDMKSPTHVFRLNVTTYSRTTTRHQHAISSWMSYFCYLPIDKIDHVPQGTRSLKEFRNA